MIPFTDDMILEVNEHTLLIDADDNGYIVGRCQEDEYPLLFCEGTRKWITKRIGETVKLYGRRFVWNGGIVHFVVFGHDDGEA